MATFTEGYVQDRVNRGDVRVYRYPKDGGLPKFSSEFPDLEPSFVSALRIKNSGTMKGVDHGYTS